MGVKAIPATCGNCGFSVAHSRSGQLFGRTDRLCVPCYRLLRRREQNGVTPDRYRASAGQPRPRARHARYALWGRRVKDRAA